MDKATYQPVFHDHEAFLKKAMKRKEFRESYEGLEEEYRLAREMLTARSRVGLTQEEVAGLMGQPKARFLAWRRQGNIPLPGHP